MLEKEMNKVDSFTNSQVHQLRTTLLTLDKEIQEKLVPMLVQNPQLPRLTEEYTQMLRRVGDTFLNLEKFVNLNFIGFHKILKKHDKHLPNPCRMFYDRRLQNQSWICGDYSDIFVSMSRLYVLLRRDKKAQVKDDAKQVGKTFSLSLSPYPLFSW
jgi:SPX domain protein involved in polyphosphate accumulation